MSRLHHARVQEMRRQRSILTSRYIEENLLAPYDVHSLRRLR